MSHQDDRPECPRPAYRARGSGAIVLGRPLSPLAASELLQLPCEQCARCRSRQARDWTLRIMHEASLFQESSFLTLTFDNDHLPKDGGVHVKYAQDFFKRLRTWIDRHGDGRKIRDFYCSEYGDFTQRPHFHACLFNFDLPDKTPWAGSGDLTRYKSELLDRLWGHGMTELGSVTPQSAAYVAAYIGKKHNGPQFDHLYERIDSRTGQRWTVPREFAHMSSRGGGIGSAFLEKWTSDIYPWDHVIVAGRPCQVPRFYDRKFKQSHPEAFEEIAARRKAEGERRAADNTPERRWAKEQCAIEARKRRIRNKV